MTGRLISAWLLAGFFWFIVGIAIAPSTKLYQQGLIILFWLPASVVIWQERQKLSLLTSKAGPLLAAIGVLLAWSALSAAWSVADEPARELKRLLYVILLLGGLLLVTGTSTSAVRWLQVAATGLGITAIASVVNTYLFDGIVWSWRLQGFGLLDHPIIGGYVMGMAVILLYCLPPRLWSLQGGVWAVVLLGLLTFIVLTRSRGVWLALLATLVLGPLWVKGLSNRLISVLLLMGGAIGYWQFKAVVLARGASYRPEIFQASLDMIASRPWLGLGLGTEYSVQIASGQTFDHSHNLFTHVAIELGIPGLLAWLWVWGCCLHTAWRRRSQPLGAALLGLIVFSTVALLFDGANLWDSPRPEWLLTWLPVGLALGLMVGDVWGQGLQGPCATMPVRPKSECH